MERLHIDRGDGRCPAPWSENLGSAALKLRFPCRDLIGVNVEMLRQLGDCAVVLDGGQSHLRLEGRGVVPAGSSAHGFSCSRRLSPLSGRNSTYRLVQISGTGSHFDATPFAACYRHAVAPRKWTAAIVQWCKITERFEFE